MAYYIVPFVLRCFQYYRAEVLSVIQQVFIESLYELITVLGVWDTSVDNMDQIPALQIEGAIISLSQGVTYCQCQKHDPTHQVLDNSMTNLESIH